MLVEAVGGKATEEAETGPEERCVLKIRIFSYSEKSRFLLLFDTRWRSCTRIKLSLLSYDSFTH